MAFVASAEQRIILEAVAGTDANIAISALAGTGKTTILTEIAKRLDMRKPNGRSKSALFCAFNKAIVAELESRLAGTGFKTKTFHGIGFGALRSYAAQNGFPEPQPDGDKYRGIIRAWADDAADLKLAIATFTASIQDAAQKRQTEKELLQDSITAGVALVHFARVNLIDPRDPAQVGEAFSRYRLGDDLYEDDGICNVLCCALPAWMERGEALAKAGVIDFDDMVYLPVHWKIKIWQNDYVMVDEAQDLNRAQRALISMSLLPAGRIFIVGDPNQAIYGFTGADGDSFDLTVDAFKATVYPMTLTRRCARVIVQHAQERVPEFQGLGDKPRGVVAWLNGGNDEAVVVLEPGDMVISRVKAPLVQLLLQLLIEGKPATILGNEIGKAFSATLERLERRPDFVFADLDFVLKAYEAEKIAVFEKKGDELGQADFEDQMQAIRFILDAADSSGNMSDMLTLKAYINSLFNDNSEGKIVLCTAHKSKGLEADRVFILAPAKLPLAHPMMDAEALQQELNLDYVARTRAKHTLAYIVDEDFRKKMDREGLTLPPYAQNGMSGSPRVLDAAPVQPTIVEVPRVEPLLHVDHDWTASAYMPGSGIASDNGDDGAPVLDAYPVLPPVQIGGLPDDVLALLSALANDPLNPFQASRLPAYKREAARLLLIHAGGESPLRHVA